jgi:Uma2 family endonuclease
MAMNPYLEETDEINEIWDGVKRMKSPGSPWHERVLVKISFLIASYVFDKKPGDLYASKTAVYLKGDPLDKDLIMPDFTFVSRTNRRIVQENGIYGAPDLVVEVVPPGVKIRNATSWRSRANTRSSNARSCWRASGLI